jgi:hypothetical protein
VPSNPHMRNLSLAVTGDPPQAWCNTCDPGCPQFDDSDAAKRHALNNPGHAVVVQFVQRNTYVLDPAVWRDEGRGVAP